MLQTLSVPKQSHVRTVRQELAVFLVTLFSVFAEMAVFFAASFLDIMSAVFDGLMHYKRSCDINTRPSVLEESNVSGEHASAQTAGATGLPVNNCQRPGHGQTC